MAQWLGQFSGRTHGTRVQDAEDALRHAVQAFHEVAAPQERERKVKNVRHLAKRLLQARLRLLKARLVRAREPRLTDLASRWTDGADAVQAREMTTRAAGVNAILVEFGVEELVRSDSPQPANPERG